MEKTLKCLFDFQKFSGNSRLTELIADTESRWSNALSDDDLEDVSAAGEVISPHIREDKRDD